MKKILTSAFAAAIAVACWSGFSNSNSNIGNSTSLKLANVEALTRTELPELIVFCQKPYGLCWERDVDGTCHWTGCMSDYCA